MGSPSSEIRKYLSKVGGELQPSKIVLIPSRKQTILARSETNTRTIFSGVITPFVCWNISQPQLHGFPRFLHLQGMLAWFSPKKTMFSCDLTREKFPERDLVVEIPRWKAPRIDPGQSTTGTGGTFLKSESLKPIIHLMIIKDCNSWEIPHYRWSIDCNWWEIPHY